MLGWGSNMESEDWERIASEYKKEIQALWKDIDSARIELEKKVPQSYIRGLGMLERTLDFSKESVRMLSCQEPLELKGNNELKKHQQRNFGGDKTKEDDFEWLYNKG